MQDGVASLVSGVDTVPGKRLQEAWQGAKEYVDVLVCEVHVLQVPLAAARGTLHSAGQSKFVKIGLYFLRRVFVGICALRWCRRPVCTELLAICQLD